MAVLAITCPVCEDKIQIPATMGAPHDGKVDVDINSELFLRHCEAHLN